MKLQQNLKRLLGVIALVTLAACSSHKIVVPSDTYSVGTKAGYGTVVMSVEQNGLHRVPFTLLYRKAGSNSLLSTSQISLPFGYRYITDKPKPLDVAKNYSRKYGAHSDNNHENSFHVFTLPVGEYEFYGMFIEDDYEQAKWIPVRDFTIKFGVNASQATYIGNMGITTKSIGNSQYAVESLISRNNNIVEDKAVLASLYPSINLKKLVEGSYLTKGTALNITSRHYGFPRDLGGKSD